MLGLNTSEKYLNTLEHLLEVSHLRKEKRSSHVFTLQGSPTNLHICRFCHGFRTVAWHDRRLRPCDAKARTKSGALMS